MTRRGIPTGPVIWYLREWMAVQGFTKQAALAKQTGWSKAKMSALYNYEQDFNSRALEEAARALGIAPFELLMHPDDAFALRRLRKDAIQIVHDVQTDVWRRQPPADHVPASKCR